MSIEKENVSTEELETEEIETGDALTQETEQENAEAKKEKKDMNPIVKEILSWVEVVALALFIALFMNHFIIINANVPTGSMEQTIHVKDRLIGFRLSYLKKDPKRGDIVMFDYPVDESQIYIKRIIGLPGEHLEIRDAQVYINGSDTPLEEIYLPDEWIMRSDGLSYDVPEGYYFVMGDNRNNSLDGRYWAEEAVADELVETEEEAVEQKYCFVSRDKILGKAIFRYYPFNTIKRLNVDPYEE